MTAATIWRWTGLAVIFLASPLCIAQTSVPGEPYLATLIIERATSRQSPLGASVQFSLHVNNPDLTAVALSKIEGVDVLSIDAKSVRIMSTERPTGSAVIDEKFLSNSFVIDFEEESVSDLLENLRTSHGSSPAAEELVAFVYEHIGDKTYARSFDLASKVAETGEGDCTEHAVLLAALARAHGMYARVVFGTLVIEMEARLFAYGHAWTEIHNGDEWQIMDATMPSADLAAQHIRYLPVSILEDEGPGYTFSMVGAMNSMPTMITGVANQD